MADVGVVGLGAMGGRVAQRLADAGHRVVGWNRTPERAATLGVDVAPTPAEAARASEVLITMLADPEALRAVVEGPDGIAAGAHASLTLIEMSTVGPDAVQWLRDAVPPETALIDAPVLGSLEQVETGTLTVFAGGDAELVERLQPLLRAVGEVVPVGPLGSGAAAKLVANSTLLGVLAVLGEAVALGRRLSLGSDAIFGVLERTPLAAQAERRRPVLEGGELPLHFALRLARKDADLVAAAAPPLPVAEAVRGVFAAAEEAGWGEHDYSAVLASILEQAPPEPSL